MHPTGPVKARRGQAAFTLIEIAVVLVIIGLLVGGILVGQSLIAQAELKSMTTDIDRYRTAVSTFRTKFDCLPGDCANATTFFGVSSTGCSQAGNTGEVTAAGGTGTCNGNGNGTIENWYSSPATYEQVLLWQHLSLAGLIPGKYSGRISVGGPSGNAPAGVGGVDIPTTIRNAQVGLNYVAQYGGSGTLCPGGALSHNSLWFAYRGRNGPVFFVAAVDSFSLNSCPFLSPIELQNIDLKFDDGSPWTGNITSVDDYGGGMAGDCVIRGSGKYNPNDTTRSCMVMFDFSGAN